MGLKDVQIRTYREKADRLLDGIVGILIDRCHTILSENDPVIRNNTVREILLAVIDTKCASDLFSAETLIHQAQLIEDVEGEAETISDKVMRIFCGAFGCADRKGKYTCADHSCKHRIGKYESFKKVVADCASEADSD